METKIVELKINEMVAKSPGFFIVIKFVNDPVKYRTQLISVIPNEAKAQSSIYWHSAYGYYNYAGGYRGITTFTDIREGARYIAEFLMTVYNEKINVVRSKA